MTAINARTDLFDLGRVVRSITGSVTRNALRYLVLAVLLYGAPRLLLTWINIQTNPAYHLGVNTNVMSIFFAAFAPQSIAVGLAVGALSGLAQAAIIFGVIKDLNGQRPTIRDCLTDALRIAVPAMVITTLLSWATSIGLILLVVPGCILATMGVATLTAEVVERPGVVSAFLRSRELTRGHRWAIFALIVVFLIVVGIIQSVINQIMIGPASASANYLAAATALPNLLVSDLIGTLTMVISSVGAASIYSELRSIKDGAMPSALAEVFD
jgi:hypothetical protein